MCVFAFILVSSITYSSKLPCFTPKSMSTFSVVERLCSMKSLELSVRSISSVATHIGSRRYSRCTIFPKSITDDFLFHFGWGSIITVAFYEAILCQALWFSCIQRYSLAIDCVVRTFASSRNIWCSGHGGRSESQEVGLGICTAPSVAVPQHLLLWTDSNRSPTNSPLLLGNPDNLLEFSMPLIDT